MLLLTLALVLGHEVLGRDVDRSATNLIAVVVGRHIAIFYIIILKLIIL